MEEIRKEELRILCQGCHQNIKLSEYTTLCCNCEVNKTHCLNWCEKCNDDEYELYVSYKRDYKSLFYDNNEEV